MGWGSLPVLYPGEASTEAPGGPWCPWGQGRGLLLSELSICSPMKPECSGAQSRVDTGWARVWPGVRAPRTHGTDLCVQVVLGGDRDWGWGPAAEDAQGRPPDGVSEAGSGRRPGGWRPRARWKGAGIGGPWFPEAGVSLVGVRSVTRPPEGAVGEGGQWICAYRCLWCLPSGGGSLGTVEPPTVAAGAVGSIRAWGAAGQVSQAWAGQARATGFRGPGWGRKSWRLM